ncbi:MAG: HAMP domain-containing protein [Desulfamplus sp.]|nr:HAMP domain-containing protein [Desulfamplus sp.]
MINKIFFHRIRYKIMTGSLILCFLITAVGFSAIRYVSQVSSQVNELTSSLSMQMTLSRDIATKTVLARVHANAYVTGYTQESLNQFIRNYRELTHVIDKMEPFVTDSPRFPLLETIKKSSRAYGDAFSRMVQLIRMREDALAREVKSSSYIIENRLTALRVAMPAQDSFKKFLTFGNAQMACMQMHRYTVQYMKSGDERHALLFKRAFETAYNALTDLMDSLDDFPLEKKNAADARDAVERFFTGFEKIYTASKELNNISRTTFNDLESTITKTAEECVSGIEEEYQAHNRASRGVLAKTWFMLFSAVMSSLVIGIFISFFIASKITSPIARLMNSSRNIADRDLEELVRVLKSLSHGVLGEDFNISTHPLDIRQNDEVGEMARAFDDIIHQLHNTEKAFTSMKSYLRKMAWITSAVARGDLTVGPPVTSKDDVLGSSIAAMIRHLRESDRKITQYQDHLQDIVEKRTEALRRTNEKLGLANSDLQREIDERRKVEADLIKSREELTLAHQAAILAEKELGEKQKLTAVMETAGAVCHELNQPLQVISGCCELLSEFRDLEPGIQRKIDLIVQQVKRMTTLNRNLMNITSYKTKSYLKSTIIDINESSKT